MHRKTVADTMYGKLQDYWTGCCLLFAGIPYAAPVTGIRRFRPKKSYYSQVALHPLSDAESGALIAAVLGVSEVPSDLQELICRKAEGNPFYLEEITRSFLERGIIQRHGATYRLHRTVRPSDVPERIQDIIVSRLDRLPEDYKHTLQTAAVIGREFAARLLVQAVHESCGRTR